MCSSACRVRLFAIYKANRLLLTNQAELTTINSDLKKNESNYYVKLNEALQELDHLNRKFLEKNVEVNMLEERVKLAEFESSKLQTKLDKWTIASMKREELNSKQRGARIKSGIGYNETPHVYPPPSTFCYSPIPKPHPSNDLIPENTNGLFAGLEGINHQEVREDYGYGASTGLGCSSSSFNSNSKKSSLDMSVNSDVLSNDLSNSNVKPSVLNTNSVISALNDRNDDVSIVKPIDALHDKNRFEKFVSTSIPTFVPIRISRPVETNKSKTDTGNTASTSKGKTKEIYVSFSDSDSNLSECDEEIECDPIPPVKTRKKCHKSHCFRCGKDNHIVKNCPELVRKDVTNHSISNRINRFVNNHFHVSLSLFKPKSNKAWVPVTH